MTTVIEGFHAPLEGKIYTNADGDQVMDIVCQQKCDRCGREKTYTVLESLSGWDCWPEGWSLVWTGWHIPDHIRLRPDYETAPILMVCPDCYDEETDNAGMSHGITAIPEPEDAHIVDCSVGQGENARIMWEHAVIDGKDVVCKDAKGVQA